MTTEQIVEGNKLIADFMNYPKEGEGSTYYYAMKHCYENNNMKYHTSWGWLMPVVEMIESIGQSYVEFGKKHCRIQPILYNPKKDCMEWQILHETQCATKIEAVYTAITSFLTWYNQQPK